MNVTVIVAPVIVQIPCVTYWTIHFPTSTKVIGLRLVEFAYVCGSSDAAAAIFFPSPPQLLEDCFSRHVCFISHGIVCSHKCKSELSGDCVMHGQFPSTHLEQY